jgi:uncharacterized membrane protein (UPF0127 family)
MKTLLTFSLMLLTSLAAPAFADDATARKMPTMTIKVGTQSVHAEVAATDTDRERGLMFRQKLGKNDGMLFVFSTVAYHAMWMKNTLIPLSVAFMDESGKIVSIHEMLPQTEDNHQAAAPARYALEMNAGWFTSNKIKVGDTIRGLEKAPKGL